MDGCQCAPLLVLHKVEDAVVLAAEPVLVEAGLVVAAVEDMEFLLLGGHGFRGLLRM